VTIAREVCTVAQVRSEPKPHTTSRFALRLRFRRELAATGLPSSAPPQPIVTEADLAGLPEPVRRYLHFMGVVGRARDWSFRARFEGRFRLRGKSWMPATAWQYNSGVEIARVFVIRLRFGGVVPMTGVDTYVRGRGEMRGKLLGVLPVAHGAGDEFDLGELVTYLNDAVLLAPSFLLTPAVTWGAVDESSFDLALSDAGRTVSARVSLDERGAPRDFSTADRFADLPGGLIRAEWTTPIAGWSTDDDRPLPTRASAIWHLPDGPLPYVEGRFVPGSVEYDVPPGA
jgi:hypothetical protein